MDLKEKQRYLYQIITYASECDLSSSLRPFQMVIPNILNVIKAINPRKDTADRIEAQINVRMNAERLKEDTVNLIKTMKAERKNNEFMVVGDNVTSEFTNKYITSQINEACRQDVLNIIWQEGNKDFIM